MGLIPKKPLNSLVNNGAVGKKREQNGNLLGNLAPSRKIGLFRFFPLLHIYPRACGRAWGCLGHDLKNKDVWGAGNTTLQVFPLSTGLKMFCLCLVFVTKTKAQSSNKRFSGGNFTSQGIL